MKRPAFAEIQGRTASGAYQSTVLLAALFATSVPSFAATLDQSLLVVTGDFDGDNLSDRVQGFPDASDGAGRVDVFWGDEAFKVAWPTVLSAIKTPSSRLISGRLGESLAVGDFDGDGFDDLALGAPHANATLPVARTHSGSVVVIYGCGVPACQAVTASGAGAAAVGSALDPTIGAGAQLITASTAVDFGRFGKSLAAGDFDDDGYDDLAIGAPGDTVGNAAGAGSVTVISGSASGLDLATRRLLHQNMLPAGASPAEALDHFGAALAATTLDLDGDDDLVVGVPDEDYGAEVSAGEVNVFWGGATGLRGSNSVSFRHAIAMAGANRSGDRLGYDLRASAYYAGVDVPGRVYLGLGEAEDCDGRRGHLVVLVGELGSAAPDTDLHCEVDIADAESVAGDGALPEVPVNFIVIANRSTFVPDPDRLPDAHWSGPDPITGATITGADFFEAEIDLLNQQLRADDGDPVCVGNDCLRLAYRSHTYYSPTMFETAAGNVCPKLHAIAEPLRNVIDESPLAITENCGAFCPHTISGALSPRYTGFSNFAEAAIDECSLLTDDEALNVVIYDVCGRLAGPDGVLYNTDDGLDCANFRSGRARTNNGHPYVFVDYARASLPRGPASTASAAEEHEAGHAIGIHHACDPDGSGDDTHIMQSGTDCDAPGGDRSLGFATRAREDSYGNSVVEVDQLIQTARDHVRGWELP